MGLVSDSVEADWTRPAQWSGLGAVFGGGVDHLAFVSAKTLAAHKMAIYGGMILPNRARSKTEKWPPPILANLSCLIAFLVITFSLTVFTQNEKQREILYRRVRQLTIEPEQFNVLPFLPPMLRMGSEWRFRSNATYGDCSQIPILQNSDSLIGQGYSKQVYRYGQVVIKRPMLKNGKAFQECRLKSSETTCLNAEIHGFIAEVGLLQKLQADPNVPKLFAYCIPVDLSQKADDLAAIVELGEIIDTIKYIDLGWMKRLNFVGQVLAFVERVQPLYFLDFRRQQFTLRHNEQPMYVDFDNVAVETNRTLNDMETSRRVYTNFANKYLWIGRPSGSATVLNRIRRQFNDNKLSLHNFRQAISELQEGRY